jgi:nucleotide-binding universal stress UspA family protein
MLLSDNPIKKASSILMAVDLDAKSQQKQRLNQLVLQHGRQLAEASGAKLHLAHIIRVPKVIRDLEVLNLHEMVKSAWRRHQTLLELTGLPKEQIHIIAGDPDLCLYQLSCRLKSDYLVIGARQRQGLMGRVIGNTAEQILRRVRSNVLVIPTDEEQAS